ncbi:MAG: hypothetical protein WBQ60_02615 [Asticcacaulis sp.]
MRNTNSLACLATFLLICPLQAQAGAWPQAPGHSQIIVSYEPATAQEAFDPTGQRTIALTGWEQNDGSVFLDYGISQRLTLTTKLNFKDYRTDYTRFSGLGSVEIGARWTVHKSDSFVLALGTSLEGLGKARRNDFEAGGRPGTDADLRAYFGKNIQLFGQNAFVDIQAARHLRAHEASQWRLDSTLGVKTSDRWMLMTQIFAGQTDPAPWGRARWVNVQYSMVRSLGLSHATSLQLGIRQTIYGENVPAVQALILGLWQNF